MTARDEKKEFITDILANYSEFSRSDLQAAVEAFAISHGLDSDKLLQEIDNEYDRMVDVLWDKLIHPDF